MKFNRTFSRSWIVAGGKNQGFKLNEFLFVLCWQSRRYLGHNNGHLFYVFIYFIFVPVLNYFIGWPA